MTMQPWICRVILVAALTIPAQASSVLAVDFQQLSRLARHVISGEVTAVQADEDASGHVYSTVTISVRRSSPVQLQGREYKFRMLGGETSTKRLAIQGMPRFAVGDRVALFLNARPEHLSQASHFLSYHGMLVLFFDLVWKFQCCQYRLMAAAG
ncbi:MAG: hypothetical protein KF908_13340 [Nitrosomonas sp.]|nr:hypothetical protein [Nitrosomonas sp.]